MAKLQGSSQLELYKRISRKTLPVDPKSLKFRDLINVKVKRKYSEAIPSFTKRISQRFAVDNLIETQCRLCGVKNKLCCKIYETSSTLSILVNTYMPITVSEDDFLPLNVCLECLGILQSIDDLAYRCYLVEACLLQRYNDYRDTSIFLDKAVERKENPPKPLFFQLADAKDKVHPAECQRFPTRRKGSFVRKYYYDEYNNFVASQPSVEDSIVDLTDATSAEPETSSVTGKSPEDVRNNLKSNLQKILLGATTPKKVDPAVKLSKEMLFNQVAANLRNQGSLLLDHGYSAKRVTPSSAFIPIKPKVSDKPASTVKRITLESGSSKSIILPKKQSLSGDNLQPADIETLANASTSQIASVTIPENAENKELNLTEILSKSNVNLDEPVFIILVNDEVKNVTNQNPDDLETPQINSNQEEQIENNITEVEILGTEDSQNNDEKNQPSDTECEIVDEVPVKKSRRSPMKDIVMVEDELSLATKIDTTNPDDEMAKFSEIMKTEQIKRWFTIQILKTSENQNEDEETNNDKDKGVMLVTYVVYYSKIRGKLVPHHFSLMNDSFSEVTRRRAYSIIHTMLKEEKNRVLAALESNKGNNGTTTNNKSLVKYESKKPFRTTCVYCNKNFDEKELMKHTMENHMVQCDICKVYQTTKDELINHKCEVHQKEFTTCERCEKKFLEEDDLFFCSHTYNCSICKKQFFNWLEFLDHEKIHFNFIALKYVRELKSDFYRQMILRIPLEEKTAACVCPTCGKKFEQIADVENCSHTYECKICGNLFNNYPLFVTHGCISNPDLLSMIRKKKLQKKVFVQCSFCDEKFEGQKLYLAHYSACAIKAGHEVDAADEIKSLQSNSPVQCIFCKEKFKSIFIFELHYSACYRTHALECRECEEIIPIATRAEHQKSCCTDVLCDFCGVSFPSRRMFRHHLRQQLDGSTICVSSSETKEFSYNGYISESFDINNCHICGKMFINSNSLDRHIKSIHLGLEKSCPLCGIKFKKFNSITMLLKHRKSHPEDELKEVSTGDSSGSYKCAECDKCFSSKLLKLIHEIYHHNKVLHKCGVCETEFVSPNTLRFHETKCYSKLKEKPVFTCEFCGKTFYKQSAFQMHLDSHDVTFTCDLCEKTFKKSHNLNKHKEVVHFNVPMKCEICGKEFSCEKYLRIHKRNLHSGLLFLCQVCGKTFHNKKRLTLHATVHSGLKPHQCRYCDKKFRTQSIRNIHEEKHKNVFKYECNYCQHKFSRFINLYVHKRKVHADKCTYQCLKCGCGYNDQEFYNNHIKTCGGRKRKNFDCARSSHCSFCDKTFASSRYLKAHYSGPSENGTYECSNFSCRKKFESECSLKMHEKVHASNKFPCKLCGEAFLGMKQLELHSQLKHNETFLFHCTHCGRGYHFEKFLKKHVKYCNESLQLKVHHINHKSKKPIVKCDSCGKIFGKFKDLRVHMTIVHGSETYKDYACRICDSKYDSFLQLSKHSKHHFKDPKNPGSFCCPKCKVRCADFDLIMNHVCGEKLPSHEETGEMTANLRAIEECHFKIEVDPEDITMNERSVEQETIVTESEDLVENHVSEEYVDDANIITVNSVVDDSLLKVRNEVTGETINYEVEQMEDGIIEEEAEGYISENELIEQTEITEEANLIYHCSFCSSNFDNIVTLQNHLNIDHGLSLSNLEFQLVE